MAIISLQKTNLPNAGVPTSSSTFIGIDLDGNLKKIDSTGAITQIGAEFVIASNMASILNLISSSQLSPGSIYNFTSGTECYSEGVEVYIPAVSSSALSTKGFGKFYNPIYTDLTIDIDGGIWNPNSSYGIGATAIWGGYYWNNTTSNVGTSDDILTLNSADWTQVPYNSNDYNVVYDQIEYDILVDKFLSRRDKNNNFVSGVLDWDPTVTVAAQYDKNPIRYFKWGTEVSENGSFVAGSIGVNDCYVENSLLLNINDRLTTISGLKLYDRSYQEPISSSGESYQRNVLLKKSSYQENLVLDASHQLDMNLENNSYQLDVSLYNSSQEKISLINSSYQDMITLSGSVQSIVKLVNSNQRDSTINSAEQTEVELYSSYQRYLDINGDGTPNIGQNNIILIDSYQQYIYMTGSSSFQSRQFNLQIKGQSYQEYISLTASRQEYIEINKYSYQSSISMRNSNQRRITFDNYSYQDNIILKSADQEAMELKNNSGQFNLKLENGSTETNIQLFNESYIYSTSLTSSNFVDLKLDNNSLIYNGYLQSSDIFYCSFNKSNLRNFTFSSSGYYQNELSNSEIFNINLSSNSNLQFTKLENDSKIRALNLTNSNIRYNHLQRTTLQNQVLTSKSIEYQSLSSLKQRIETYNISCITASVTTDPYWLTLSNSNFFVLDIQANTELGLTAVTTNGGLTNSSAYGVVLKISNNSYSVGFTGGTILWNNGTPPTLTTGGIDFLVFLTHDYGQTWHGNMALTNLS